MQQPVKFCRPTYLRFTPLSALWRSSQSPLVSSWLPLNILSGIPSRFPELKASSGSSERRYRICETPTATSFRTNVVEDCCWPTSSGKKSDQLLVTFLGVCAVAIIKKGRFLSQFPLFRFLQGILVFSVSNFQLSFLLCFSVSLLEDEQNWNTTGSRLVSEVKRENSNIPTLFNRLRESRKGASVANCIKTGVKRWVVLEKFLSWREPSLINF